jgi:uncharacterized protein with GYD domain
LISIKKGPGSGAIAALASPFSNNPIQYIGDSWILAHLIGVKEGTAGTVDDVTGFLKDRAMSTFIMLTRLNTDAVQSPRALEELEREVMKRVREECPGVEWRNSYAVLGPCDYLDVFVADDIETAAKVSTLIRTFGHAQTEIWTATEWDRFKELVRTLPVQA